MTSACRYPSRPTWGSTFGFCAMAGGWGRGGCTAVWQEGAAEEAGKAGENLLGLTGQGRARAGHRLLSWLQAGQGPEAGIGVGCDIGTV